MEGVLNFHTHSTELENLLPFQFCDVAKSAWFFGQEGPDYLEMISKFSFFGPNSRSNRKISKMLRNFNIKGPCTSHRSFTMFRYLTDGRGKSF